MQENPLVVVGSGLAGLLVARLVAESRPVVLFTKLTLYDSNTRYSQGGIAAVWSSKDSVELHSQDTMEAGAGLCDPQAVRFLSENSRNAIEQLIQLGTLFDVDDNKNLLLGLEGAHSVHRILHAGGDATGFEIQRALVDSTIHHPNIEIHEYTLVTEILSENQQVSGVRFHDLTTGQNRSMACDQVILATGGAGQVYSYTSNPECATGDGVVLAHRLGAAVEDLEFYQFHPTALRLPNCPNFLITEAMRGEGAILRNHRGEAFMGKIHPLHDLAPRDIVSRAIAYEMSLSQDASVFLDSTGLDSEKLVKRFPTIFKRCLEYGVDIRKDPIPVTPVAHYMIGGVKTDLSGRSTFPGLYACGEVARTGVHGANRLASNSLLEAAVFAIKIAKVILNDCLFDPEQWPHFQESPLVVKKEGPQHNTSETFDRESLRAAMWKHVGLIRNEDLLLQMLQKLGSCPFPNATPKGQAEFELETMTVLGKLMAQAALLRKESVGAHYRRDALTNSKMPLN